MNNPTVSSVYEQIIRNPYGLKWNYILGGSLEKHSRKDADYAMIAGTTLDTVSNEAGMLQKWNRPWLYRKVFTIGALASVILASIIFSMILVNGKFTYACLNLLFFEIPPCVVPITLMVFFWEMNAPRNISLLEMLECFFVGGVLSIFFTLLLENLNPLTLAMFAPLTEEPAKLLAAILFLKALKKRKGKVYGLNGLAIGAAVGAGFAAFESGQYAYKVYCLTMKEYAAYLPSDVLNLFLESAIWMDKYTFLAVGTNICMRALATLVSHVIFCAFYSTIVAFYMAESRSIKSIFKAKEFLYSFFIAFFSHMVWNTFAEEYYWATFVVLLFVLWSGTLWAVRKSFAQLVARITISKNATSTPQIQGISGVHGGVLFSITHSEVLIGSSSECQLNFPVNAVDISPKHCKILLKDEGIYIYDLGSLAGTYINNVKCAPMTEYPLHPGDVFYLGSPNQSFKVK